jgi:hypothetical protein
MFPLAMLLFVGGGVFGALFEKNRQRTKNVV